MKIDLKQFFPGIDDTTIDKFRWTDVEYVPAGAWQEDETPPEVCSKLIGMTDSLEEKTVLILFSLELLHAVLQHPHDGSRICFLADAASKKKFVEDSLDGVEVKLIPDKKAGCVVDSVREFGIEKFDYLLASMLLRQSSTSVQVVTALDGLFDKAAVMLPCSFLYYNQWSDHVDPAFKAFKSTYGKHIDIIETFSPTTIPEWKSRHFVAAKCYVLIDSSVDFESILVQDGINAENYQIESLDDATIFGSSWTRLGIRKWIEKLAGMKSLADCAKDASSLDPKKTGVVFPIMRCGTCQWLDRKIDEQVLRSVLAKGDAYAIVPKSAEGFDFINNEKGYKNCELCFDFRNEEEAANFISYCKTKTFRFLLAVFKDKMQFNRNAVVGIPMPIDLSAKQTDATLVKQLGISDELWNYIDHFIPDFYEDYRSGFEEN